MGVGIRTFSAKDGYWENFWIARTIFDVVEKVRKLVTFWLTIGLRRTLERVGLLWRWPQE